VADGGFNGGGRHVRLRRLPFTIRVVTTVRMMLIAWRACRTGLRKEIAPGDKIVLVASLSVAWENTESEGSFDA
jgi:hypothetical protein